MKVRITLALLALAAPVLGQSDRRVENLAGGPPCGSSHVPRFITPGNFQEALDRARAENRALLVKGVAFGMDELGALDPTRGHW